MISKHRRLLVAVCIWQTCVVASFLAVSASINLVWSKGILALIVGLGLVVIVTVAYVCPRFGKIGGAALGLVCGLIPGALILALTLISRHDMFDVVGTFAVAVIVAVPSGIAGAIAGIICSGQDKKTFVAS